MAKKQKIDSDKPEKAVKKKKVGRPKKRGRKKNYYTPKKKTKKSAKKGFSKNLTYSRVRAVLWTNFKDDFPSYRAFISNEKDEQGNAIKGTSVVSQVFAQCKDLDCLDSDIIEIYNQFRNQTPTDERPILPNYYYDPHYYWELLTEDWWTAFDNRLWIVSPMLLTDPDNFLGILGADRYVDKDGNLITNRKFDAKKGDYIIKGKSQRFEEFVNYCNSLQTQGLINSSDAVPNWRFVGEDDDEADVYWNPFTKRWEVRIVICDPFGNIEDYDFNPLEPDSEINGDEILAIVNRQPIEKIQEQKEEPLKEEPISTFSKEEIEIKKKELEQEDKRIKIEEEKQEREKEKSKRKDKLLERYLDGKIDEKTFLELLKLI